MTARDEAHRLIDAVPEDRLAGVVEILQQWTEGDPRPRRRLRTIGVFDGEVDLGARVKDVVREGWDADRRSQA